MARVNQEEWRCVPGFSAYEVSETGSVRRLEDGIVRKPYLTTSGYLYLCMRGSGHKKAMSIHRLVALAFLGHPPSPKHQVAHFDGDKIHNHVSNLRWATRSENERDKVRHGRSNRGEGQGRHRLTEKDVISIRKLLDKGMAQPIIAQRFNVARPTISSISTGKSWGWL